MNAENSKVYVSITGLRVKGGWHTLRFWYFTLPAMMQAKKAAGNLQADARLVDGVQHTLSVWQDEAAMRAYISAGAHRKAMSKFSSLGTGSTFGAYLDAIPDWNAALALWKAHCKEI